MNQNKASNKQNTSPDQLKANHSFVANNKRHNNQNYSSRNSLRSANNITLDDTSKKQALSTKPLIMEYRDLFDMGTVALGDRGIETNDRYEILNAECFLKDTGQDLVCLLCQTIERNHSHHTAIKHLNTETHNNKFGCLRNELLKTIPAPESLQMQSLNSLLKDWFNKNSLTELQINLRVDVMSEFEQLLNQVDPQCKSRLVGSLLTGTSTKRSNINLELIHPNSRLFESDPRAKTSIHHKLIDENAHSGNQINLHCLHYDLCPNAVATLHKMMLIIQSRYQNPPVSSFQVLNESDLSRKVPKLVLEHLSTNVRLEITCYSEASHKLSSFLRIYMSLDPRAQTLGILVKHWAHLCEIDDPEGGSLPPDTYLILLIYHLQRTQPYPVLPCLHEILPRKSKTTQTNGSTKNTKQTTSLPNDTSTANQNLEGLENDESDSNESPEDEEEDYVDNLNEELINLNWSSGNTESVTELFAGFLRRMIIEFDDLRNVISIRTLNIKKVVNNDTKVKPIENPVKAQNNISRCIGSIRTFDYIKMCFKRSLYYMTSLPLDSRGKPKTHKSDSSDLVELYYDQSKLSFYFEMRYKTILEKTNFSPIDEMIKQNIFARDVEAINFLFDSHHPSQYPSLASRMINLYNISFLKPLDRNSIKYCWCCRANGHSKSMCPSKELLNLREDYASYDHELDYQADFDEHLYDSYRKNRITPGLKQDHDRVVETLRQLIRNETGLPCKLELFGSTVNKLGSQDSDLDICLTLENNSTGRDLDCVDILEKVERVLRNVKEITSLEAILSARVPILKFKYKDYDVDLSMYNLTALHNSKLLRAYAELDPRVGELFYLVKRYAKVCGIADASKGTLSSYAWSLLVIHYLQRTEPPILPVLQERNSSLGERIIGVNGWNVWFNKELDFYSNRPKNESTLTQLFKGFLLYYGRFDFNLYVVTIRKNELFTKYQKNWHHCLMAIEDPFELTYNLSGRLDDAMAAYIINSFTQAFKHIVRVQRLYLNSKQRNPNIRFDPIVEIFSGRSITGTSPPYRNGCRICFKIGHKIKDCPIRRGGQRNNRPNRNRNRQNN